MFWGRAVHLTFLPLTLCWLTFTWNVSGLESILLNKTLQHTRTMILSCTHRYQTPVGPWVYVKFWKSHPPITETIRFSLRWYFTCFNPQMWPLHAIMDFDPQALALNDFFNHWNNMEISEFGLPPPPPRKHGHLANNSLTEFTEIRQI